MKDGKKFEAVLLDMDGVLIKSFDAWHSSINDTLKRFGKDPITKKEHRKKLWGPQIQEVMDRLGLGKEGFDYWKSIMGDYMEKIKIYPETKKVLSSISVKTGLITNAPENQLRKTLDYFDLEKFFNVIIHEGKVEKPKPSPEPLSKACDMLSVNPKNVLFVGDTKSDFLAGKSAGCTVVGINTEGDLVIKRLNELPKILPSIFD